MNREAADSLGVKGPDKTATRLIFVGDISPSMYLVDAGPDGKETRYARMGAVVDGILQRVSGNLRFGVVGFYTDALPVVMEARDPELVRNVFNGLPLSYGMPVGQTDLGTALNIALARVAEFPPGTVRLIVLTDGDTIPMANLAPRPPSVKEVLILGLGNPHKGTFIDGHQSRQEGETLQRIASQLGGTYDDVNTNQLATTALGDLVVTAPPPRTGLDLSEWAILCMVLGASVLALLSVALAWWGSDWEVLRIPARERRAEWEKRGGIEPELAAR
jgi:Ca-activated chloride channel family protein